MSGWARTGRAGQGSGAARGVRGGRGLAALLLAVGLLLGTAACGNDAQTLRPYTPGEGVNFDVGDEQDIRTVVHVRNLLIISKKPGSGVLSALLVTDGRDELTKVTGNAIKADGSAGAPLTVTLTDSVTFANRAQVVLTDRAPIGVTSADLAPGRTASMTLSFATAGDITVIVPVADGTEPQYADVSAAPATPSA